MFVVSSGADLGGNVKIAPHGTLNDGTLSLVTATGLSRCRALRSLLGVEDGTHVNRSYVSERKVLAMKVEFLSQRGFVVLDGEPIDLSPVCLEVHPGLMRLMRL